MVASAQLPCRPCRNAPSDSEEHLFHSALGGRRRVRGVLCTPCNSRMGAPIDADMIESLAGIRMLLAIEGDRGQTASVRAVTEQGIPILLRPGGLPEAVPAKPGVDEAGDIMRLVSNSEEQAREVTEARQRKRRDRRLEVRDVKVTKWFPGRSKVDVSLNVETFSRPALKTVLTLLANRGLEDADAFVEAWRYVNGAPASDCGVQSFFSATPAPWDDPALGPVPHRVTVRSDPGSSALHADVRYFGDVAFCFLIRSKLAEAVELGYGVDPFTGRDVFFSEEPVGEIGTPRLATSDAIHDAVERAFARITAAAGPRQITVLVERVMEECTRRALGGRNGPADDDDLDAISSCVHEEITFIARREAVEEDAPEMVAMLQAAADKVRNRGR